MLELGKLYPDNAHIKYKIGLCYLATTRQKSEAIPYLKSASKNLTKEVELVYVVLVFPTCTVL